MLKHNILPQYSSLFTNIISLPHPFSTVSEFNFYDYTGKDAETVEKKTAEIVRATSRNVFSLSDNTLFRSMLIKRSKKDYLFLVVMHHIITDKWSMSVFRDELANNYTSLVNGQTPKILKPEIQYASYAYWQQNRELNIEHLAYWKEKLSGDVPALNLPMDFSRKTQPTYAGIVNKRTYSEATSIAFFDLCKTLVATPYMVMLSVYYLLLQKYQRNVVYSDCSHFLLPYQSE